MKTVVSFVAPNFRQGPKELNAYYLPYSAGVIWSYAYQFDSIKEKFRLDEFIWKRDSMDMAIKKLANSNIIGFSTYIWNRNYNFTLAQKIKEINPNALIVFGGPEPAVENKKFFELYPFIDICIKKEGEISFKNILENYHTKDFSKINGLLINNAGILIDTGNDVRIDNLDHIPSPYLTGVFDKLIQNNSNITWNATLETNRGCPYACTFCDWGSLTYNKIKKFDLHRVYSELEWIAKNKCDYLSFTDANFGIFPERDNLIADKLIEVQKLHGYPKQYSISWAKNQKEDVVNIVKKLITEGGSRMGLNLSVQTLDETTLDIIKRKNLETHKIEKVFELCENNNIPLFTELILGLPGQTLDKFKEDFFKLYTIGNHTGISVYQAQLLENAEMNLLQRKLYKIKGMQMFDYIHGSTEENELKETIEVVISTVDLPPNKMIEAQVFAWYMNTFHINGLTNYISRFLNKHHNITYKDFYENLYQYIQKDEWFNSEIERIKYYFTEWFNNGKINHAPIQGIEVHGFNLIFTTIINIQCHNKISHAFDVIQKFIVDTYGVSDDILEDLMHLQKNYIIDYKNLKEYPIQKTYKNNILSYIQNSANINQPATLQFEFPEPKDMTLRRFCEQLFFSRRRNFGKALVTAV